MKKLLFVLIIALAVLIQLQTSDANAATREVKEWTFLTFMNGHNNLDVFAEPNLQAMAQVGSTDEINIVVQVADTARPNTQRVVVNKGSYKVLQTLPRVDMGDQKELKKFIEWAVENYPAKKYFLNVWNHGSGWHNFKKRSGSTLPLEIHDVSFDDYTRNFITTEQMGEVMEYFAELTGDKVELYGNDACLMQMIEIGAEISDSVKFMASSQDNEPGEGWPYAAFLKRWAADPYIDGAGVGKILTEEYYNRYGTWDEITTFSTINLQKLDGLIDSLGDLAHELSGLDAEKSKKVQFEAMGTHAFFNTDYKDLYHFVSKLEKRADLGLNKATLSSVKSAFDDVVIITKNADAQANAHGLSVWLPTFDLHYDKHISRYQGLEFNKQTGWSHLLEKFFQE